MTQPDATMLDRVARAICDSEPDGCDCKRDNIAGTCKSKLAAA